LQFHHGTAYGGVVSKSEVREPTFLILSALADAPRHGYGVMREVETMSEGRVTLRAGTLYAVLDRLVKDGLVVESGSEIVGGRLRRYYSLTDDGAAVLELEAAHMAANAKEAAKRLRARIAPA
jgi:DNA-binding PadR family transcriptional regulator